MPPFAHTLRLGCLAWLLCITTAAAATPREQLMFSGLLDPSCTCQSLGVTLVAGQRYRFEVEGRTKDAFVHCDARGPRCPVTRLFMSLLHGKLRVPRSRAHHDAHFLTPIGVLACAAKTRPLFHPFVITPGLSWQAPANGPLHVFANDWPGMNYNNSGCLKLRVWRELPVARAAPAKR